MMKNVAVVTLLVLLMGSPAFAIGRRGGIKRLGRRSGGVVINNAPAEYYEATDQRKCELEAAYKAAHGITGHIWSNIGNFEGVGWGGTGCATCTPKWAMTLTGDAQIGNYRVRSWR